ncbi:unnamed protein product [Umbelopsis sp. WA50703]
MFAYTAMRGNSMINYGQLGLAFHLYGCEVLFNRGICRLYNEQIEEGMKDLEMANSMKLNSEHDIIADALRDEGKGYSIFSIPSKVLYRPPKNRLNNMEMLAAAAEVHSEKNNGTRHNSVLMSTPRKHRLNFDLNFKSFMSKPSRNLVSRLLPSRSAGTEQLSERSLKDNFTTPTLVETKPTGSISVPDIPPQKYRESAAFAVTRKKIKDDDYKQLQQETIWKSLPTNPLNTATTPPEPSTPDDDQSLAMLSLEFPLPDATPNVVPELKSVEVRKDSGFHSGQSENVSVSSNASTGDKTPKSETMFSQGEPLSQTNTSITDVQDEDVMGYYESSGDVFTTYEALRDLQDGIDMNVRLKIKLHHDDMRILVVPATIAFSELAEKVKEKFDGKNVKLLFKDEDDELITMQDETDIMQARIAWQKRQEEAAGGVSVKQSNPEKLDIWCQSVPSTPIL